MCADCSAAILRPASSPWPRLHLFVQSLRLPGGWHRCAIGGRALTIAINRECQWTAASDVDWIGLNPKSGQGDSAIAYSSAPSCRDLASRHHLGQRLPGRSHPIGGAVPVFRESGQCLGRAHRRACHCFRDDSSRVLVDGHAPGELDQCRGGIDSEWERDVDLACRRKRPCAAKRHSDHCQSGCHDLAGRDAGQPVPVGPCVLTLSAARQ